MPRFDGTGPLGKGPLTGRGGGYCVLTVSDNSDPADVAGLSGRAVGVPGKHTDESGKGVSIMPRGDGTGPAGMGPMTGRAAGRCAGYPMPGYANRAGGGGFWGWLRGRGWGRGRGRRNAFYGYPAWGGFPRYAPPSTEEELDALKQQAEDLEEALGNIRKRVGELEAEGKKDQEPE